MKPERRLSSLLRYKIDNLFSRGTTALIVWLALLSAVIVIIAGVLLYNLRLAPGTENPFTFPEAIWISMVRTLGGGSTGGRESNIAYRLVMLGLTFGGIFFTSALIGILTTGLNARMETLRKGRSTVMEKDHIIILGWTPQVFSILAELITANADRRDACMVILGGEDKTKMEDSIRLKLPHRGRVRVVCRTGSPIEMDDLRLVNLNDARSIIVLSPDVDNPDSEVIKTILAITNFPGRRKEPYHIVAGIRSPRNYELIGVVGREEVEWVRPADMTARMIAQTCRQSGLSTVYTNLLDFGSDEIYWWPAAPLAGIAFGKALHHFPGSSVIGLQRPGEPIALNPPMDTILQPSDQLVLIARDDSMVQASEPPEDGVDREAVQPQPDDVPVPETTLILGWNWRGSRVLEELDHYVTHGSSVTVMGDTDDLAERIQRDCQQLENQTICYRRGDIADRHTLLSLELGQFNHIIVLSYSDRMGAQQADALTMVTLLHLRDLADQNNFKYSIVSEMMDVRNRKLAAVTRADDFIVSDRLVSLLMAQVAENRSLNAVFTDLFDPGGSEIYLKPVQRYVPAGKDLNFYTVVESACCRNEIAIGYRLSAASRDSDRQYGIVLNPPKDSRITFSERDRVIVLAEH